MLHGDSPPGIEGVELLVGRNVPLCGCTNEPSNYVDHCLELVISVVSRRIVDRRLDVTIKVVFEEQQREGIGVRLERGNLREDVIAVPHLLDHVSDRWT
jgi:hypothetical protein